jgi:hypothetical protein
MKYFDLRLFFLTILKPLKQYTLFKKEYPFRTSLRSSARKFLSSERLETEAKESIIRMPTATFRFYEELNDFLPNNRKKVDFEAALNGRKAIKETIEEFGVPPVEVDLVLINGKSVDFNYIIKDGDRVSVYPVFESFNIQNVTRLRRFPLRRNQFIADTHLKKIVEPMRILGFNIDFNGSYTTQDIIEKSIREKRIILTTRKELKKSKSVTHCILLRPGTTRKQITYVMEYLDVKPSLC